MVAAAPFVLALPGSFSEGCGGAWAAQNQTHWLHMGDSQNYRYLFGVPDSSILGLELKPSLKFLNSVCFQKARREVWKRVRGFEQQLLRQLQHVFCIWEPCHFLELDMNIDIHINFNTNIHVNINIHIIINIKNIHSA